MTVALLLVEPCDELRVIGQVVDTWLSTLVLPHPQDLPVVGGEDLVDQALRIVLVPEVERAADAGADADRGEAGIQAVEAEVTLPAAADRRITGLPGLTE